MGISINSNPLAMSIGRTLGNITQELKETSERIATGKKLLKASDDPAGIGIISNFKSQYASWGAVEKNISSGQSLLNVAAGALKGQSGLMVKLKDLATQAASELLTAEQRDSIQKSFVELQGQMDTIVNRASIFGQNLVGTAAADVDIQSGINAGDTKTITNMKSDTVTLGIDAGTIDLTTTANAALAITALDTAVDSIAASQSMIGAQQAGFESLTSLVKTTKSSLEDAMSRIEDADITEESTKLSLLQSQQQLGIQALGIVNQMPQYALNLIR